MGWQDRQYGDGGGGRFGDALRRVFGEGENPLMWSVPLYQLWGIGVRIHIFYIVYILVQFIRAIVESNVGLPFVAIGMAMLFVLVLLHEYGHCFSCRWVDGEADRIVMWPLGGLAFCAPPHHWRAHLITAIGGPAVNVVLYPVFAAALWVITGNVGAAFYNPFDFMASHAEATLANGATPMWLTVLWWAHFMNLALLGFNMVVPMYPMDAGRVLHAILWRSSSYNAAMRTTTTVGLVAAGVLVVVSLVFDEHLLLAIALFGGVTCWMEKRRLAVEGDFDLYGGGGGFGHSSGDDRPKREGRAAKRRAQQAAKDQAELDRLLAKIAKEGMGRLSKREKRFLERESTKRKSG